MFLIDRYLLKQFVQIFVICFLSMAGLFIVIDAFENLDAFSAQTGEAGNLLEIITRYYAYRSLGIFERTSSILAMLAAMFTVTWLSRHQELTALLAAGISKVRVLKPLLLATIVVSLLGVLNRELIIPQVRDELMHDTKDLGGNAWRDLDERFDSQTNILLGGEKVDIGQKRIIHSTFVLPGKLSRYGKRLMAKDAYHQDATDDHPAGFLLENIISPAHICKQPSLRMDLSGPGSRSGERGTENRPIIITPHDATWLEPNQLFVVSAMPFTLLANGSQWHNYASTGELIGQLSNPSSDLGADARVTLHTRLVQPFMDITLVMLGLPLMLSRKNRNIFLSIGICVLAALAFSAVAIVCQSLGGFGILNPVLAAWLPLMVFIPLAVGMSGALRT